MTLELLCWKSIIYSIYNPLKNLPAHVNRGSSRIVAGKMLEPIGFFYCGISDHSFSEVLQ